MKRLLSALGLSLALAAPSTALADEKEAETCLRNKIWNDYNDGWAVRTATTTKLAQGEHKIYLVTLYAGNQYKLRVCADGKVNDVDLVLHNSKGEELARDQSDDREPTIAFKPTATETFYVAVYMASTNAAGEKAGTALAVIFK
jgi:hypothetical protein